MQSKTYDCWVIRPSSWWLCYHCSQLTAYPLTFFLKACPLALVTMWFHSCLYLVQQIITNTDIPLSWSHTIQHGLTWSSPGYLPMQTSCWHNLFHFFPSQHMLKRLFSSHTQIRSFFPEKKMCPLALRGKILNKNIKRQSTLERGNTGIW